MCQVSFHQSDGGIVATGNKGRICLQHVLNELFTTHNYSDTMARVLRDEIRRDETSHQGEMCEAVTNIIFSAASRTPLCRLVV